jgi:hypothetical protein
MTEKIYLEGDTDSPAGHAPAEAWLAKTGDVERPEEVWLEGNPLTLLRDPADWFAKLKTELKPCPEVFGLRARFCLNLREGKVAETDLFALLKALLDGLSWRFEGLFLHGELVKSEESGIHLAWENRPPALITQLWVKGKNKLDGALPILEAPLHLNVLLHDTSMGYNEFWNDGTLGWFLKELEDGSESFQRTHVKAFSLARSDMRDHGLSAGLEEKQSTEQ